MASVTLNLRVDQYRRVTSKYPTSSYGRGRSVTSRIRLGSAVIGAAWPRRSPATQQDLAPGASSSATRGHPERGTAASRSGTTSAGARPRRQRAGSGHPIGAASRQQRRGQPIGVEGDPIALPRRDVIGGGARSSAPRVAARPRPGRAPRQGPLARAQGRRAGPGPPAAAGCSAQRPGRRASLTPPAGRLVQERRRLPAQRPRLAKLGCREKQHPNGQLLGQPLKVGDGEDEAAGPRGARARCRARCSRSTTQRRAAAAERHSDAITSRPETSPRKGKTSWGCGFV